jgi:hypothetical protein
MPAENYPGRPGVITPVAQIGENVVVFRLDRYYLYRVLMREGIQPSSQMIRDFGALGAGAVLLDQSLQIPLEMDDNHLAQYRWLVQDDIRVTLKQPRATSRFGTKQVVSTVTLFTPLVDPCGHLSEFFSFEDEFPFADIQNPTAYALLQTRLLFWGFKYRLQELKNVADISQISGVNYTAVVGQAFGAGGQQV